MEPMKAGGLCMLLLVVWTLYRAHRDASTFSLLDLLMQGGRADKLACVFMGTWALHSWIMLVLLEQGKMDVSYVTLYAATWVAPIISKLFTKGPETSTSFQTDTVSSTSVTTEKKLLQPHHDDLPPRGANHDHRT